MIGGGAPIGRPSWVPRECRELKPGEAMKRFTLGQRYELGMIHLWHALCGYLASGEAVPEVVASAVQRAFDDYEVGIAEDLAVPFGVAASLQDRRGFLSRLEVQNALDLVEIFHAEGYPKTKPEYALEPTAFHMAGDEIGRSAYTVHAWYTGKRRPGAGT